MFVTTIDILTNLANLFSTQGLDIYMYIVFIKKNTIKLRVEQLFNPTVIKPFYFLNISPHSIFFTSISIYQMASSAQ